LNDKQAACECESSLLPLQRALRRMQLADNYVGQILQEAQVGQHSEWKDIADHSPIYKSYWAQWKFLVVRDNILECHLETANGETKTAQRVLLENKVKEVLAELHGGHSGHVGGNKTLDKIRQWFSWLYLRRDVERWCQQCDTCAASQCP
jgi:hypothetical protein